VNNTPNELRDTPEGKSVLAWFGWKPKGKRNERERDDDDDYGKKQKVQHVYPTGGKIEKAWGGSAYAYGVWRSADFSQIWFGDMHHVEITGGEKPTAETKCLAPWYPCKNDEKRDPWCCDTDNCTAHALNANFQFNWTSDKTRCPKRPEDAVEIAAPHFNVGTSTAMVPYSGGGSPSQGRGGGGGGRGKGKGGKGKGGKGHVKGKGGGGGKGRGKGHRHETHSRFYPLSPVM
jgi:hypothetical protein